MIINKLKKTKYGRALLIAAEEVYIDQIVATEMEKFYIGKDGYWESEEDWINSKIEEWIKRGKEIGKVLKLKKGKDENNM